jgi:hypothetical protein
VFPSSGEGRETPILLGHLERANLNHWSWSLTLTGTHQSRRPSLLGLERGPLCLVNTTKELLQRKSSGSDLESREYGRRDPSR